MQPWQEKEIYRATTKNVARNVAETVAKSKIEFFFPQRFTQRCKWFLKYCPVHPLPCNFCFNGLRHQPMIMYRWPQVRRRRRLRKRHYPNSFEIFPISFRSWQRIAKIGTSGFASLSRYNQVWNVTLVLNGPCPSCCLSRFRSESWCSTIVREMSLICIRTRNSFPFEWLCTRTRFETEACSNSEMGYYRLSIPPVQNLSLRTLRTRAFVMPSTLVTAQRGQTIHQSNINYMVKESSSYMCLLWMDNYVSKANQV